MQLFSALKKQQTGQKTKLSLKNEYSSIHKYRISAS